MYYNSFRKYSIQAFQYPSYYQWEALLSYHFPIPLQNIFEQTKALNINNQNLLLCTIYNSTSQKSVQAKQVFLKRNSLVLSKI